jgi:hypothetical protein
MRERQHREGGDEGEREDEEQVVDEGPRGGASTRMGVPVVDSLSMRAPC